MTTPKTLDVAIGNLKLSIVPEDILLALIFVILLPAPLIVWAFTIFVVILEVMILDVMILEVKREPLIIFRLPFTISFSSILESIPIPTFPLTL